ncbi:MAG TPA: Uma2 family endonuclease [Pyrinomonadaceae bacterium]|nr:Uma2 family endonuclease [Pyrinomonadaceae bacterium]
MSTVATPEIPVVIHFGPLLRKLDDREFFEFCQLNRDLRIERTREGDVIVTPPTGSKTGLRSFSLTTQFGAWVEKDKTGRGFDSSTGFKLPNGATRSPDVSWIQNERWEALAEEDKEVFAPLCPDFVVELRSPSDQLDFLQAKMREYVGNGARLGWLIDPLERTVYIYRQGAEVKRLADQPTLSGGPLLPGLTLDLKPLWD